jgi:Tfp pilus assembly protein PilF
LELGLKPAALAAYEQALRYRPLSQHNWLRRASLESDLGHRDNARLCYLAVYASQAEVREEMTVILEEEFGMKHGIERQAEAAEQVARGLNQLVEEKDADGAIDKFNDAIKAGLTAPQLWLLKAEARLAQRKPRLADKCCLKAIAMDARDHRPWLIRARALEKLNQTAAARDCYRKALELEPECGEAWAELTLAPENSQAEDDGT